MKYYELTYLTRQDLSEDEAKKIQDKLAASIQAKEGVLLDFQKAYKKRLAYPVKKQEMAYVCGLRFQMETQPQLAFKDEAQKDSQILRSLIVTYTPLPIRHIIEQHAQEAEKPELLAQVSPVSSAPPAESQAQIKPAEKPRARREKPKADLKEISEKLDEILK